MYHERTEIERATAPNPPRSLWHNRDFLLLWSGQGVSTIGTQASQLAFPLLILALTRSPAQAGIVGALRALPFALLVLAAGALVDRWDRKRVMILCDTGRALTLGSIPLAMAVGHPSLVQLCAVAVVEGTLFTFFNVCQAACLPRVVPSEQLHAAVAQSQAVESIAMLLGPALGGFLYGVAAGLPFLSDALSYTASVVSLRWIMTKFQAEREVATGWRTLWSEIVEGLFWLWCEPRMRFLALLMGSLNLFSFGYVLIIIVLAQHMHVPSFTIGLILATGGIGSVAGAMITPWLRERFTFGQIMIGSTWIWALTWPLYMVAPNPFALGVVNGAGFITVSVFMVTLFSYRLSVIPDHLQGRVNSVYKLIAFGIEPISMALTGALLQLFGPVTTLLIIFTPQVGLAIVATLNPHLRHGGTVAG